VAQASQLLPLSHFGGGGGRGGGGGKHVLVTDCTPCTCSFPFHPSFSYRRSAAEASLDTKKARTEPNSGEGPCFLVNGSLQGWSAQAGGAELGAIVSFKAALKSLDLSEPIIFLYLF
jgi:hypothetical protein